MAARTGNPRKFIWLAMLPLVLVAKSCSGGMEGGGLAQASPPPLMRLGLRGGGAKKKAPKPAFKPPHMGETCSVTSTLRLVEMAKFPKDAAIIKEGMKDLYLICLNAEKQKRIGAFKGGCKALISALQVHWKDASVMVETLSFASNLCYAQPNIPMGMYGWSHIINQEEIGRMGGVRFITNAMKHHDTTEEIQNLGTRALANLAYNHTQNAARAVKWGSIERVVDAMRVHTDSFMVQEAGCIFLYSCAMSIQNETHITYGVDYFGASAGGTVHVDLQIAGRIAEVGGVDVIIDALERFGNSTEHEDIGFNVGEQGCAALWYLSSVPGRLREAVRSKGGVELAKMVIRTQRNVSECAVTWGARLLEQLTGKDCSKYRMAVQVPGPSVYDDRIREIKSGERVCQAGCGCEGLQEEDDDKEEIKAQTAELMKEFGEEQGGKGKKKKGKRLEFEKGADAGGQEEDGEVMVCGDSEDKALEGGARHSDEVADSNSSGDIAVQRVANALERESYEMKVGKYKKKDRAAKKALRAGEEERGRKKNLTALEAAKEKEALGLMDSDDEY